MDKDTAHIVITGHLDHGKSTLIGRLLLATDSLPDGKLSEIKKIAKGLGKKVELSFLVDQFKEEKQQDRTIETTQINIKTKKMNYVLIDAPGHAELIANMLTGASMADAAVLIIAANEGIKEQTLRHAYLIKLLGINRIIVVLNKMDLVKYKKERFEETKNIISGFLRDLGLNPHSVIPVSAKENDNISGSSKHMSWYRGPDLLQALDKLPPEKNIQEKPLRFCVQDVYNIKKEAIAVGKVVSGTIKNGQSVILLPSLKKTRVGFIRVFGKNKKTACAGENIGLTLRDPAGMRRGQVIASGKNYPLPVFEFASSLFWISPEPLRINQRFRLRLATQDIECIAKGIKKRIDPTTLEVLEENANELEINEAATLIFKTTVPVVIENFSFIEGLGRFVVERKNGLCGVGIVTK